MDPSGSQGDQPLAISFVNTAPVPADHTDLIANYELLGAWLAAAAPQAPAPALPSSLPAQRIVFQEAHRLRTDIDQLLRALSRGVPFPDQSLATINRMLEQSEVSYRLERSPSTPNGLQTLARNGSTSITRTLHAIALDAARVVSTTEAARLRQCAADDCPKWFIDTSKGGRRKWCSMATCGNRSKAANFRTRHAIPGSPAEMR